ncbi:MAG: lamin tail domain-containing protein [Nanoarchaeota archaeon]|nr:lamin tail domain-containing protein [Nanoarchaeota archaeon]
MKKVQVWLSMLLLILIFPFISALSITEVESNPEGEDSGFEWVELYSDSEINLSGYKLVNNDGGEVELNGSFSRYYVYTFEKQWLDNSDEKVFLYHNDSLIQETSLFEDSKNNGFTWQLCDSWEFKEATKNSENICESSSEVIENESSAESSENSGEEVIIDEKDSSSDSETIINSENDQEETNNDNKQETESPVIVLSPKDINNTNYTNLLSKYNYPFYGLIVFCMLIIILLIIKYRKGKNKNEFEEGYGNQGDTSSNNN